MIMMGQCIMAVKNKIKSNTAYRDIELNYDVVELLRIIKKLYLKVEIKSTPTSLLFCLERGSQY